MPIHPRRLSLAGKILLLLLANVTLVATAFAAMLALQVRLNPGWLLAGRAGDRVQGIARALASDLAFANATNVPALLQGYSEAHGVPFLLFDADDLQSPDVALSLPPEARQQIQRLSAPGAGRALRAPDSRPGRGPPPGAGPRRRWQANPRILGPDPFPQTVVRAGKPAAYWIAIRLPVSLQDEPRSPRVLVLKADSLWSGGLLLDARPWAVAALAALVISIALWLPFTRRLARDIAQVTRRTETIAGGHFEGRLELQRGDELGRLSEAINQMATRLAEHVSSQKRFLSDAAHELCAPLARMQTSMALLEARQAEGVEDLREDIEEMAALVNEILAFSRAAHGRAVSLQPVPLREAVERAWRRENSNSNPDSAQPVLENLVPEDVAVLADPPLLNRALANVLRNALRYAGRHGPIRAGIDSSDSTVRLRVADAGPGVPAESLPRLFDPFFRPEASRSREFGGSGLGLAIVKSCVLACGGDVNARNLSPQGFEVVMEWRRASAAGTLLPRSEESA